jgi:cytochrome c553
MTGIGNMNIGFKGCAWRAVVAGALAVVWLAPAVALAGDPQSGKVKARACIPCHGKDGLSKRPDAPNIAGQNPFYMDLQLKKYRSGERRNPVMNVVANSLSDEEIADLVAYYAAVKITVEIPE